VEVCADNWLSALRAGREQTGDPGGVPPGASCVMAESGEVTILDPARRIRYLISPASLAAQQPEPLRPGARDPQPQDGVSAPVVEPTAPPAPVAQLDATSAPEEPSSAGAAVAPDLAPDHAAQPGEPALAQPVSEPVEQAPAAVQGADRLADAASSLGGPETDASPARPTGDSKQQDTSTGRAQQTLAYNAQRADALEREYEAARALVTSPEGEAEAEADSERGARPNLRALPPVQRGSASTIPPPPKLDLLLGARARPSRPSGLNPTAPRLVPAFTRDVDPTPQSPITYRERAYVLAPAGLLVNIEDLMQAELIKLRGELAQAPRGQLIHLAAFIKPFHGTPSEPPVATLEWSDWRSNAVFVSNAAEAPRDAMRPGSTSRPPSAGPAEAPAQGDIPAPGSQVAPIPRPPTPLASPPPASASPTVPEGANTATEPPTAHAGEPTPVAESEPVEPAAWTSLAAQLEVPPPAGTATGKPLWSTLASKLDPAPATPHAAASTPPPAFTPPSDTPPPAFTPPSDTAALTQAARPAPVIAPALPWMSAPLEPAVNPSAPAVQSGGVRVPPAFQAAESSSRAREERDDTGEVDSRLASAFEALPDLYFLPTPVAGLEFTTQLVSRLVPCEAISVCLYDINTDEFRFVAVGGPGANQRRASAVPSSAGLFGAAKRSTGDALVIKNVEDEPRYQQAVDGRADLEVLDLAYVPLRHRQQLLGMVQLINRAGDRGFTSSDAAVLHYIANQLAEFLASRRAG
jgi:GAF domain